jgi:hypothetical protein
MCSLGKRKASAAGNQQRIIPKFRARPTAPGAGLIRVPSVALESVSGYGAKEKIMKNCETHNANDSMPIENVAVEPKQELRLKARKEKMTISNDDGNLIRFAALMYDGDDVDTESSEVFEVSANDNLYVLLLSYAHKVAAVYEYSTDEEDHDMDTMKRVSEEYFQSVTTRKCMDAAAYLAAVCEECNCRMCNRVLESLKCATPVDDEGDAAPAAPDTATAA